MHKSSVILLTWLAAAPLALADTIYLKNGSVIHGKVSSFAEEQFLVVLNTGSDRQLSKAMIHVSDVARIEFDLAPALPPEEKQPEPPRPNEPTPADQPRPERAEKVEAAPPPAKKPAGQVRTATVDVLAQRDWTSTGLIVRRGDVIRITASGTVALDSNGQTSGPEGIELNDPKKLMPDRPTGALIAVIGADNDDFIFIGKSAEFVATRDGLLFLSINEGTLSDNSGSYKAIVEVQSQRGTGVR
jgi:hypothetical protein